MKEEDLLLAGKVAVSPAGLEGWLQEVILVALTQGRGSLMAWGLPLVAWL